MSENEKNVEINTDEQQTESSEESKIEETDAKETIDTEQQKLKEEINDLKEKFVRICAEYDNFRKRTEKEKNGIYQDAISFAILSILPVADSLQAAVSSLDNKNEELQKGIQLIKSQLDKSLKTLGVTSFGEIGDKFDPSIHSAVSHIDDDTEIKNEIIKVYQKGYKSEFRVIRHAMVQVIN